MMKYIWQYTNLVTSICLILMGVGAAQAAGDPNEGEKVFKKCMACHKIGDGAKNSTGPVLTGVIGRKVATYTDYSYGKSMRQVRKTGLVWDEENLDAWLKSPKKYLRKLLDTRKAKAKMKFKLKKQADRDNVIAYLKTFSAEMEKVSKKSEAAPAVVKAAMPVAATDICVEN